MIPLLLQLSDSISQKPNGLLIARFGGIMKKYILRGALLAFALTMSSSAFGQQRWFENGTTHGSYKRVEWGNVAAVTFYNPTAPFGARITTWSNDEFKEWLVVPNGSPSIAKLLELIKAKKERWIKMQPHENGRFLTPNEAVGYIDVRRILSSTKVTHVEFGQEVYVLAMENTIGRVAVIDPTEKARIDKMISDSVVP